MSASVPPTMRAWTRPIRGPVRTNLHLATVLSPSTPAQSSSDVLIRVAYVALNFSSEWIMETIPSIPFQAPMIPELEFSGVVVGAGSSTPPELQEPGTRVMGFVSPPALASGRGVLAEYVSVPATQVLSVPDEMDLERAAALITTGVTALKMIRTAGVRSGDRVLVNGASGSVGNLAVQLCKDLNAEVVGVASGANEELVTKLGADEFVDYRKHDPLPEYLVEKYGSRQFDHILDCVGTQALYTNSPSYLKPTGAVINIGAFEGIGRQFWNWSMNTWRPTWLGGTPRRYVMFSTPPNKDDAAHLVRLAEAGKLKVLVDSLWKMEDARQAYEKVATKRAKGKVVIKVQDISGQ